MQNDYVAPVDHGVLSSTGNVAIGTVGGAMKTFGKVALWCLGIGAVLGGLGGAGVLTPIFAAIGSVGGVEIGLTTAKVIGGTLLGLAGGGLAAAFLSVPSALFGAGKGAVNTSERVSQEKGAARAMEMQLAAYQSMAANNESKYNLPAQGSRMNPAMAQIDGSTLNRAGTVADRQLALGA